MWDKKIILHPIAAEIARQHNDCAEEIRALSKYVQALSRQSNWAEADNYRPRLKELVHDGLQDGVLVDFLNTESFYWLADCLLAQRHWDGALALLRASLIDVTTSSVQRGIIAVRIKTIAIALQQGKPEEAAAKLKERSSASLPRTTWTGSTWHSSRATMAVSIPCRATSRLPGQPLKGTGSLRTAGNAAGGPEGPHDAGSDR